MRISDWSSDVCSSDLHALVDYLVADAGRPEDAARTVEAVVARHGRLDVLVNNAGAATVMPLQQASYEKVMAILAVNVVGPSLLATAAVPHLARQQGSRSEEHTSELQSLMRISYAVFCLKKKKTKMKEHMKL